MNVGFSGMHWMAIGGGSIWNPQTAGLLLGIFEKKEEGGM